MTDKEKEIREMAQIMCCAGIDKVICHDCLIRDNMCDLVDYAIALYNAGYRKADDVKKETAKEILQEVGNMFVCLDVDNEDMFCKDLGWFKVICKKYGVEVDE